VKLHCLGLCGGSSKTASRAQSTHRVCGEIELPRRIPLIESPVAAKGVGTVGVASGMGIRQRLDDSATATATVTATAVSTTAGNTNTLV